MEWIPRTDLSKLPTDDYCQVLVNLQTPTRLETTVMTYYPPEYDEDGIIGIEHSFSRYNPQSWDNNFTHYCLFPEPCEGKNADTGESKCAIQRVSLSEAEFCDCAAPVENVDKGWFKCTKCGREWHEKQN